MLQAAAGRLESVIISPLASIAQAMAQLDVAGTGVLVLADERRKLLGVVTDGDIRRAILRGVTLDQTCGGIASADPVVASPSVTPAEVLHLLDNARGTFLNNIPLVHPDGTVAGLLLRKDIVTEGRLPLSAVIMAGGYGTRLLPLTENVPKPMLPVGDRPLLQRTLERMSQAGIERVAISTHHLAERITSYFGDGRGMGLTLDYVSEDRPLGTAGALRLVKEFDEPLLVINGDILTGVHFQAMLAYHREQRAEVTVGVRRCELQVPYGVLECDGPYVRAVREKPRQEFLINAGIYLLQPSVRECIPVGERFDMTDLIRRLLEQGRAVASFPITEYWLDIGQPADYDQAQEDVRHARL